MRLQCGLPRNRNAITNVFEFYGYLFASFVCLFVCFFNFSWKNKSYTYFSFGNTSNFFSKIFFLQFKKLVSRVKFNSDHSLLELQQSYHFVEKTSLFFLRIFFSCSSWQRQPHFKRIFYKYLGSSSLLLLLNMCFYVFYPSIILCFMSKLIAMLVEYLGSGSWVLLVWLKVVCPHRVAV